MQQRSFGRTGWNISAISFGAWAIGGDAWGTTDDAESMRALHCALDEGINFFDTADVYGDGHSERLIAQLRRERTEPFYVATKAGRRLPKQTVEGYSRENLTAFVERSLRNLSVEALDLLQLHCPPSELYEMPDVFGILDDMVAAGKLRFYGVSVERVEEAIHATAHPNVQSVQIIFNMFRPRPADEFFALAKERSIGILARVPLASGLLSGALNEGSSFAERDHRHFNRRGEAFDVGETFSGVDYNTGLAAAREIQALLPDGMTLAQAALRWILDHDAVSAAIPGARRASQVRANASAASLPPLDKALHDKIRAIYDRSIREGVHHRW